MTIEEILWKFHNELKEQQSSGRSVTQGNAEILAQAKTSLLAWFEGLITEEDLVEILATNNVRNKFTVLGVRKVAQTILDEIKRRIHGV